MFISTENAEHQLSQQLHQLLSLLDHQPQLALQHQQALQPHQAQSKQIQKLLLQ